MVSDSETVAAVVGTVSESGYEQSELVTALSAGICRHVCTDVFVFVCLCAAVDSVCRLCLCTCVYVCVVP